jgi:hypothetical protein
MRDSVVPICGLIADGRRQMLGVIGKAARPAGDRQRRTARSAWDLVDKHNVDFALAHLRQQRLQGRSRQYPAVTSLAAEAFSPH